MEWMDCQGQKNCLSCQLTVQASNSATGNGHYIVKLYHMLNEIVYNSQIHTVLTKFESAEIFATENGPYIFPH